MLEDLKRLDGLAAALIDRARGHGLQLIWRAQVRSVRTVQVREGKTESTVDTSVSGHGIQLVSEEGRTALASRDDFREEPALELLDRLAAVLSAGGDLGLDRGRWPTLEPLRAESLTADVRAFSTVDLAATAKRLHELERPLRGEHRGVRLRLSWRADLDAWRVFRSDGTDVLFTMPRCTLGVRATTADDGARHGVAVAVSGPDPRIADDRLALECFLGRADRAARLATVLPDAPAHAAGSFPVVIDYALAKGLAHEAFGHAAEADGFRSSVLARDGRLRQGELVGAPHVSIVDEPLEGDHAWQPFSANGLRRERAVLVDHGLLLDGLSDPWSAEPGGVRLTGAARAESFRNAPQPRMTNIRIEVDDPLPAAGRFDDYEPEQVRDLLAGAGVFRRHPRVVFLSGYNGGQVNTAVGDFVFQCKAIYDLDATGIRLHKPAIFSGSMFGALRSIREAFGGLVLDSIGYCGKWGQSVPSSGGSHYFLVLDPDPSVRLGGR